MNEFNVGDIVILRSGSAPMTIQELTPKTNLRAEGAVCVWMTAAGDIREATVDLVCLAKETK